MKKVVAIAAVDQRFACEREKRRSAFLLKVFRRGKIFDENAQI